MRTTFAVTGGNTGLGVQSASQLSLDRNTVVILACRDVEAAEPAAERMRQAGGRVEVLSLDLAKQPSIHAFVTTFRAGEFPSLAGLVCNAGGQSVPAPTRTLEGYETTFGVNHLSQYLLARLMLPDLAPAAWMTFVASNVRDTERRTSMPAPRYEDALALAHDFES